MMYGCYKMQMVLAVPPCGHSQAGLRLFSSERSPIIIALRFLNCQSAGHRLRPVLEARTLSCKSYSSPALTWRLTFAITLAETPPDPLSRIVPTEVPAPD